MQAWPYAVVLVLILAEAAAGRWFGRGFYGMRDTEVGLGLVLGWALAATVTTLLSTAVLAAAYAHRFVTLPLNAATLALAVVLADLLYYAWHVLSHRAPFLWASHAPHHTSQRMNALASVRQGWTDALSGVWFVWSPLALIGIPPGVLAGYFAALFVWEACTHNEWCPRLGPLEWVLVTPSNHRVHHSLRPEHRDRNFGAMLIVWDRLFGTYATEGERLTTFGVDEIDDSAGVVGIAFFAWRKLLGLAPGPRPSAAPHPP